MPGLQDTLNTFQQTTAPTQLTKDVANIGQYAQEYTNPKALQSGATQQLSTVKAPPGGIIEQLGSFVGTVAGQAGGIVADLGKNIFNSVIQGFTDVGKFVNSAGNLIATSATSGATNDQINSFSLQSTQLTKDYNSGKIDLKHYNAGMRTIVDWERDLGTTLKQTVDQSSQDVKDFDASAPTVVEDVVAIATAGTSKGLTALAVDGAKTLGDGSATKVISFFGQHEVSDQLYTHAQQIDSIVQKAVDATNKVTTLNGRFSAGVIATITHDTIGASAATMTAEQIAKNVAVNLILKRPLIYQTNVGLATSVYTDMAKGDLTGGALTMALVTSMALSGGPIGYAMQTAGKGLSLLRDAIFSGGKVGDLLKAENEANIKSGLSSHISQEIIDDNAKTSISRQSFIDALSTKIGGAQANQIYNELLARAAKGDIKSYQAVKILEETNMKMAGGNSVQAAQFVADHYNGLDGGKWLRGATAGEVIDDMMNWAAARQAVVEDAITNGMDRAEAERIVVGRANVSDLSNIADIVSGADKSLNWTGEQEVVDGVTQPQNHELAQQVINTRLATLNAAVERFGRTAAWANSNTFMIQLDSIIRNNLNTEDMTKAIMKLRSQAGKEFKGTISPTVQKAIAKKGYFAVLPEKTHTPYVTYENTTGGLKSRFAPKNNNEFNNKTLGLPIHNEEDRGTLPTRSNGTKTGNTPSTNLFEYAVAPVPVLSSIGSFLTRIGLSPEAAQNETQQSIESNFNDIFTKNLSDKSSLQGMSGKDVMQKLYSHVRDQNQTQRIYAPVTDLRQMTLHEIKAALGSDTTTEDAKVIASSLNSAWLHLSWATRGIGDKIQDVNMTFNPAQRFGKFSRLQGTAHFVINPFFRLQQGFQTEGLAQAEAGGKALLSLPGLNWVNRILFPGKSAEVEATSKLLEDRNIFGQGFSGVGSTGDIQGQIGTRITASEKVSLSGLVNAQAEKAGLSPQNFIDNNQSQVVDLLRMITTNNHSNGFLDSPLARTINTVFFPFRYNMKVANLMAGYLGKLSAPTQVAMIAGLVNANAWFKTDDGLAWQSTHAEAIGLFNWLSPTYPLSYVVQLSKDALGQSTQPSISDLGQLGGLPFGMISQLLESSGVVQFSAPYIDQKTGDVYPKYIPKTAITGVSVAIQDLLGSLFSYPGAVVGLPGKTKLIRDFVNGAAGINGKTDFTQVDQSGNLTAAQAHDQQIIKQTNGTGNTPPATTNSSIPSGPTTTTITPPLPAAPAAKPKNTRAKKSSFRPTSL